MSSETPEERATWPRREDRSRGGWSGKKNGDLLRAAAGQVDAFITIDKNLVHQQSIDGVPFVVVVLSAPTNRLTDLLPLVPQILEALGSGLPGHVVRVGG